MLQEAIKKINLTILSMAAKQKILDNLESKLFSQNIYKEYINILIEANLNLMNIDVQKIDEYKKLIIYYISGEINNPDEIIDSLQSNKNNNI